MTLPGGTLCVSQTLPPMLDPLPMVMRPSSVVSPTTTPVPWSLKKLGPICAPGWMSMPVLEWAMSEIRRASSGVPSS